MLDTCRADIDGGHACGGMTDRVLRRLPRPTTRDKDVQIGTIFAVRPQQMMFGTMNILIEPHLARAIEILYRRRKRVIGVEVADGISFYFFGLHECFRL